MPASTLSLVLFVFLLGLILGFLCFFFIYKKRQPLTPLEPPEDTLPADSDLPEDTLPPDSYFPEDTLPPDPDLLDETSLAAEIGLRLAGTPADGSALPEGPTPTRVIWVDAGDEALVHLDSMRVRISGRTLVVSIDLETDQTGKAPVIVAFALGGDKDEAGLVATTDEVPYGNSLLASRWGACVRASVWNSLLGIAEDHADKKGLVAASITAQQGQIRVGADAPLNVRPRKAG